MSCKYEFGHTLQNGARVIESKQVTKDSWLALCYWENNIQPYVVWQLDNYSNAYWGRYYVRLDNATNYYYTKHTELLKQYGEICPANA